jgi:hypothetical protein
VAGDWWLVLVAGDWWLVLVAGDWWLVNGGWRSGVR